MGTFLEYSRYDALGLADLVRTRQVSPLELVDAAIERIEAHNPQINAVVYPLFDEARRAAMGDLPDGPLRGVPYWTSDGLPVGMHFAGRFGDEATLFRLAGQLEQAQPWADRAPRLTLR